MIKVIVNITDLRTLNPTHYGYRYKVEFSDGSEDYYNTIKDTLEFQFKPELKEGRRIILSNDD